MSRHSPEIAGPEGQRKRYVVLAVCGFLLLAVGLVFGQTFHHEFVNYDDNEYVYENSHIVQGPTAEEVGWAFTTYHAGNWHPLTWLSHILDYELYGLRAGGHHATNVLLHAVATTLLFLVLWRMTGDLWPSAFVAAIFAVHPPRVESVAWVAERKDVLSGLFFMLTLLAYVEYIRRPFSLVRYLAIVALFALGLMAKPMLVTLPFVLLLLDYWPLGRMVTAKPRPSNVWHLVVEKIPLCVLAAASCAATTLAQVQEIVVRLKVMPLSARISNAAVCYVAYLGQFFYPVRLAVLYPHPGPGLPLWKPVAAIVALTAISIAALVWRQRRPYLLVGWFWYLGMLIPVIGLVQVGSQAMADRYTYLPQIGLGIALAWGAAQTVASWPYRRWMCGAGSALVLAMLLACAWRQTTYWRDSATLWNHTLACTSRNSLAHNDLGLVLADSGQSDEAIAHYRQALKIEPYYADAHFNLAKALCSRGLPDEAIAHYRQALKIKPDFAKAHINLANILISRGQVDEAIVHYRRALKIKPDFADGHYHLASALAARGGIAEAITHYQEGLKIKPSDGRAHNNLGLIFAGCGRVDEAITEYQKALRLMPDNADVHNNLGSALLGGGRIDEAIVECQKALKIKPDFAEAHCNLGNALVINGRVNEAIAEFRKALKINPNFAGAHYNLGNALVIYGRVDEAIVELRKAVKIQPGYAQAHYGLGSALLGSGQFDEAIAHFQEALKIRPDYGQARQSLAVALSDREGALKTLAEQRESLRARPNDVALLNDTAWALATNPNASLRGGAEAVKIAQRAVKLSGGQDAMILATLAAAYAEARRFSDAVQTARKAANLATLQGKPDLLESLQTQLPLYEAKTPFRESRHSSAEHSLRP